MKNFFGSKRVSNTLALLALCLLASTPAVSAPAELLSGKSDKQSNVRSTKHYSSKHCMPKRIQQCDLPYVISKSGQYEICNNIVFNPLGNNVAAITISANDVDLSFNECSLSQATSSTTADNFGVLISSGVKNIRIHNGSIRDFSASSIRGLDGLENINIHNMKLQGLLAGSRMITELIASGIQISGSSSPSIATGLPSTIINISNVLVYDYLVNERIIAGQATWGIYMNNCKNITVTNCMVNKLSNTSLVNAALNPSFTGTRGYSFLYCSGIDTNNCIAEDLTALSPDQNGSVVGDVAGFIFFGDPTYGPCEAVNIQSCFASNLIGTRRAVGFVTSRLVTDVFMENNVSENIQLVNPDAPGNSSRYGFEIVGTGSQGIVCRRIVLKNCQMINGQRGFAVNAGQDVLIQQCTAIAFANTTATSNTVGFFVVGDNLTKNVTIEDCIADGFQGAQSTTPGVVLPTNGFGFLAGAKSTVAGNPIGINCRRNKAYRCSGGIVTEAGIVNGDAVIESNEVAFNTIIGIANTAFPFPTVRPTTKDLIMRNIAYANGTLVTTQYPAGSQYAIITGNTVNQVLFQANQGSAFPSYTAGNASDLSNYDLQP